MSEVESVYRARLVAAATALRDMEGELERLRRDRHEPIAIVGMGCRFPGGADDPAAYWRLLDEGVDAVTELPPPRRAADDPGTETTRLAAYLDSVDSFDAEFFGIPAPEAERLDPQQRLLLEVAWEALEDAGTPLRRLNGTSTGVFIGMSTNDYLLHAARSGGRDSYTGTGTAHAFGPGRLSYLLGLRGPSLAVDTACSSSLVAAHLAMRSLRDGESDLALAGGVNLILDDFVTDVVADLQALSPDGRCRTFDARANGFVRGEGAGVVVLKRLGDALANGDRVHAVIRGSAVNSDGRSAGLTVPNPAAQSDLLRHALADAGAQADDVGFVETHGTGTALGDPLEFEALTDVFGASRGDGSACVLGAVKTQIGHLEAAAGVAGLIKAVLVLQHRRIPGNVHLTTVNPRIRLDGTPFVIRRDATDWPTGTTLAGVSSFGMSGTNAHLLLAEAPPAASREPVTKPVLLPLAARSKEALSALASAYADRLEQEPSAVRDIAYTAGLRGDSHEWRWAAVGTSAAELTGALRAFADDSRAGTKAGPEPSPVFVFSGQGTQWIGMGRELLAAEPGFATVFAECDKLVGEHTTFSLTRELMAPAESSRLADTEVLQPILFGIQVALSALLAQWGVRPGAVIGHSVGEVAAAHVAGALPLPDAARLVATRSRISARANRSGGMVAVTASADDVRAMLKEPDAVAVAAINDSGSTVLSGPAEAIGRAVEELRGHGVPCRRLPGDYPFHSPAMVPLAEELGREISDIGCRPTTCPMFSTVHGKQVEGTRLDSGYWAANLCEPVRFADAVGAAVNAGYRVFVEVAPHAVLARHIDRCLDDGSVRGAVVPTLRRDSAELPAVLRSLARLYTLGHSLDMASLHPHGRVVSLPGYPWRRQRYWLSGRPPSAPVSTTPTPTDWPDAVAALPAAQQLDVIERAVCADAATVLGLTGAEEVPAETALTMLGMDSLMAVQLRHELVNRTGLPIPATLVFEHPTPRAITHYMLALLRERTTTKDAP
ncbi:hypothetical protein ALI144C_24915 [Actinosynnema sp. ALI-1.44]|uniref:type I polyketide synthase n=1 Tax=Actinosynnema sp. ALI-1.44 TaxID=1933779 RepID=UPI00097BAD19|nr:type I polyketide synthase [Actinosynnema sp. ALI-1.44]ONI79961.1 hypothetical protein ALI144C_24915 [Actinosynnema sp. ALI-1.44]